MIFVWRGWGLLSILIAALCMPTGIWLSQHLSRTDNNTLDAAVGLLITGAALVLFGVWLNQVRAAEKVRRFAASRRAELDQLVMSGQFNLGHPWPIPTSMGMATEQSNQVFAAEVSAVSKALHNRNTLYGIPMQYWGYLCLLASVVTGIVALLR